MKEIKNENLLKALFEGDGEDFDHLINEEIALGFTGLELAKYLGKKKFLEKFSPPQDETKIKILFPNSSLRQKISKDNFFHLTGIEWIDGLYFDSFFILKQVIKRCPWLLSCYSFAKECYVLPAEELVKLHSGVFADVTIVWMNEEIGYGLINNKPLKENEWIGVYAGEVRKMPFWRPDPNGYCLHYPTNWYTVGTYLVDASKKGNYARFINHSDRPNICWSSFIYKGVIHFILRAKTEIERGSFLTVDYGPFFW